MERNQVILYEDLKDHSSMKLIQLAVSTHLDSDVKYILKLETDHIQCLNTNNEEVDNFSLKEIECVNLSMCSRYAGGTGRYGGIRTTINIDVDIILKDKTVLFEIVNPISFQKFIDLLKDNDIEMVDMVGVVDLYKQYPDYEKRARYLETHFNELSKKFHLDHPRFKSRFRKKI